VRVRVVSQGVMVLREEDPHVPATAAVYLASLVVHHATVRVREKVKARTSLMVETGKARNPHNLCRIRPRRAVLKQPIRPPTARRPGAL